MFAGDGLTIFLGRGPAKLDTGETNPLATGVLLTNGRIGLIRIGSTYALVASGTVSLIGVAGVTLTGTVAARVNTTGAGHRRDARDAGQRRPPVAVDVRRPPRRSLEWSPPAPRSPSAGSR